MKLLYCKSCGDIFNLTRTTKTCSCGGARGYYKDTLNSVYSGNSIPLGFDNHSFLHAILNAPINEPSEPFTAFVIPENCKTFIKNG